MIKIIKENTNDSIVLNLNDQYTVASQISMNLKAEWDAVQGYDLLIQMLKDQGDADSVAVVEEIISDEKNHAMLLEEMISKYDGDIPVAED